SADRVLIVLVEDLLGDVERERRDGAGQAEEGRGDDEDGLRRFERAFGASRQRLHLDARDVARAEAEIEVVTEADLFLGRRTVTADALGVAREPLEERDDVEERRLRRRTQDGQRLRPQLLDRIGLAVLRAI